jgi:hypothetical protein
MHNFNPDMEKHQRNVNQTTFYKISDLLFNSIKVRKDAKD